MAKVKDIMTGRGQLVILSPNDSVAMADAIMKERNIHSVLVTRTSSDAHIRIFTMTDLVNAWSQNTDLSKLMLERFSNAVVHVAEEEWTCEECKRKMGEVGKKHLPVLDRVGTLVGIVSAKDVRDNC